MSTYQTDAELLAALHKWQKKLHLEDWEIVARLVPRETLGDDPQQVGDCAVRMYRYGAEIRLASPDTIYNGATPELHDMERTLVHELLHCVFVAGRLWDDPAAMPTHQNRAYECAIEQMARTVLELDRRAA